MKGSRYRDADYTLRALQSQHFNQFTSTVNFVPKRTKNADRRQGISQLDAVGKHEMSQPVDWRLSPRPNSEPNRPTRRFRLDGELKKKKKSPKINEKLKLMKK